MNEKKSPYKLKTLKKYQKEYDKGEDIPFGIESSLIAQGMIPRQGGVNKGKKVKSPEYMNEKNEDDEGYIAFKSQIDKTFNTIVVYPEYEKYDTFEEHFKNHGLGFLDIKNKTIYIDGSSLEGLNLNHILAIQAHEIGHYKLKHRGNYSRKQELEADIFGINILNSLGYIEAASILKERMEGIYNKKEIEKFMEKNKYVKTFEQFVNERYIKESMINEGKKYGVKSGSVDDLIKMVKKLPDTIQYINVPKELSSFQPNYVKITPDMKDWKNEIIKTIKGAVKGRRGNEIDEFVLRSYYGDLGGDKDPFYIAFGSEGSRKFADDMHSGKYGSLD